MTEWFIILDPQTLKAHTDHCLQTGCNICVFENGTFSELLNPDQEQHSSADAQSVPVARSVAASTKRNFFFRCGNFEEESYIYAIKLSNRPWHYFDECDTYLSQHDALPSSFREALIASCFAKHKNVRSFYVNLSEDQWANYFSNDQFVFKDKKLKTRKFFKFKFNL